MNKINKLFTDNKDKKLLSLYFCAGHPTLECTRNKIGYFEFKDGQPCKVDFKIEGEEYSTMEVKLYAYKG